MRREPQKAGEHRRYLQHADKFMELADLALPELAGLLRPPHGVLYFLLFHHFEFVDFGVRCQYPSRR